MYKKTALVIISLLIMLGCAQNQQQEEKDAKEEKPSTVLFLNQLQQLCNTELQGEVFADNHNPETVGSAMSFRFEQCTDEEVRIITQLPGEEIFTIIITLMDDELLLKHDVRDTHLSPHDITMYGGFSDEKGNKRTQVFPVHNFGGQMWPGYENTFWEVCYMPQEGKFEYLEVAEDMVKRNFVAQTPNQ